MVSSDKNSMLELGNSNQSAQLEPASHYAVHTSSHLLHRMLSTLIVHGEALVRRLNSETRSGVLRDSSL